MTQLLSAQRRGTMHALPTRASDGRGNGSARGSGPGIGTISPASTLATEAARDREAFAQAAGYFLQQRPRQLPSRFLYDALGSALFEAICLLPWYRVTRAELELLTRHAVGIGDCCRPNGRVVELGCGNGDKLAALLTHARAGRVRVHLIDSVRRRARAGRAHARRHWRHGGLRDHARGHVPRMGSWRCHESMGVRH